MSTNSQAGVRRLIIRTGAIGDCLLSLPAIEFLRAEYTEVWVPSAIVPLINFADKVCSIASTGLERVGIGHLATAESLRVRLRSFDEIVSWYGANRSEFREAIESIGVPCQFHRALPPAGCTLHATDFFAAQVGAPPGGIPHILIEPRQERKTVLIHPFSGSAVKNWPLTSFRELAGLFGEEVEWLAGPEEELPGAVRMENLRDVACWMKGAKLYVGNDSGMTHLAAAVGVRTVALFAGTRPEIWGPRGDRILIVRQDGLNTVELMSRIRIKWPTL